MSNLTQFDSVLQFSEQYLQRLVDANRENVKSQIAKSLEDQDPVDLEFLTVKYRTTNIEQGAVTVALDADAGKARFKLSPVEVGLDVIDDVEMSLPMKIEAEISFPAPIAGVEVEIDGQTEIGVGLVTTGLELSEIEVVLLTGHPLDRDDLLRLLILNRLRDQLKSSENPKTLEDVTSFPPIKTSDLWAFIHNDETDPSKRIEVLFPEPDRLQLIVPVTVEWSQILALDPNVDLAEKMGVDARLSISAPFRRATADPEGFLTYEFASNADVDVLNKQPTPESVSEYQHNVELGAEPAVEATLRALGYQLAQAIGDRNDVDQEDDDADNDPINVLTLAELEESIASGLFTALTDAETLPLWTRSKEELMGAEALVARILPDTVSFGMNPAAGAGPDDMSLIERADGVQFSLAMNENTFTEQLSDFLHTPEDPSYGPFLFNLDAGQSIKFQEGTVTETVRDKFASEGHELAEAVEVENAEVLDPGDAWTITAGDKTYVAVTEDQHLRVHRDFEPGGGLGLPKIASIKTSEVLTTASDYSEALDDKTLPSGLKEGLAAEDIHLSNDVFVKVDQAGSAWTLEDVGDETEYKVTRTDGTTTVTVLLDEKAHITLDDLSLDLQDGFATFEIKLTLHRPNAILKEIQGVAKVNAELSWEETGSGTRLKIDVLGKPKFKIKSALIKVLTIVLSAFLVQSWVAGLIVLLISHVVVKILDGPVLNHLIDEKALGPIDQLLASVGLVESRFVNPIQVHPSGIVFFGEAQVTSRSAQAVDPQARAQGPYHSTATQPLTLTSGTDAPETVYSWQFGDGDVAQGQSASHVYRRPGVYNVRLASVSSQYGDQGELRTWDQAGVYVENVPPEVEISGPSLVNEGSPLDLTVRVTDPVPGQQHRLFVDWGDNHIPEEFPIEVVQEEPSWEGQAKISHTYCKYGQYPVQALAVDEWGGEGEDKVFVGVSNVAPAVDAGEDLFTYRCVPIRLRATFCDPGWCNRHTAVWDFGDCTPPQPATVIEINEPPAAEGIAVATHTYSCCGAYTAQVTVTDDGGKSGTDTVVVRMVDITNGRFEDGFHDQPLGSIANGWEAYLLATGANANTHAEPFQCEHCVVHGGQRSQRIGVLHATRAGLLQSVGANPGWDYQVVAWFHVDRRGAGRCRLGLDPSGGRDPDHPEIEWVESERVGDWFQLVQRVTARGRRITLFLEAEGVTRAAYWDDVTLHPYPCALDTELDPATEETQVCIDWSHEQSPRELGSAHTHEGFAFSSLGGEPLRTVADGPPKDRAKLSLLSPDGVGVVLPQGTGRVTAEVFSASAPVTMTALDAADQPLATAHSDTDQHGVQTLSLEADQIAKVRFSGGTRGTLAKLCIAARQRVGCSSNAPPDPLPG